MMGINGASDLGYIQSDPLVVGAASCSMFSPLSGVLFLGFLSGIFDPGGE